MDAQLSSPVGERVYCHECNFEWARSRHGLECPHCQSDFTEVLEAGNDPRDVPQSATTEGQPRTATAMTDDGDPDWEDAPDPGEDGIAHVDTPHAHHHYAHTHQHGGMAFPFMLRIPTQDDPGRGRTPTSGYQGTPDTGSAMPIPHAFQTMLQGILGGAFDAMRNPGNTPTTGRTDTANELSTTGSRSVPRFAYGGTTTVRMGGTPEFSWTVTTTQGPPMPGAFFPHDHPRHDHGDDTTPTNDTTPRGNTPFPTGPDLPFSANSPLPAILNFVFGGPAGQGGRGPTGLMGPFAMLAGLGFDPANMQHGDAVYSQEALDRIITGLMEQHQSGSAPGPASEEAISSLTTRPITQKDLGTENRADCSICMDEVHIGDQVTDLPCHHWFHGDCVKAWLAEHDTCPHCRQSIMPKPAGPDDVAADRLRTPMEAPRHDHSLGSPLPPGPQTSGEDGTYGNPWTIPESPWRRTSQSAGPSGRGESSAGPGGDGLFNRMRSAFGGSGSGSGSVGGAHNTDQVPRPSSPD